jgi:hypothetical protein
MKAGGECQNSASGIARSNLAIARGGCTDGKANTPIADGKKFRPKALAKYPYSSKAYHSKTLPRGACDKHARDLRWFAMQRFDRSHAIRPRARLDLSSREVNA